MAGFSAPQGRSMSITRFAAGSASRSFTVPSGAIGGYFTAANAFELQMDGTGDAFHFAAGAVSFYVPVNDHTSVTLADQAAADTGECFVAWELG